MGIVGQRNSNSVGIVGKGVVNGRERCGGSVSLDYFP